MVIPETYTLHVESRDEKSGIWLVLDDGKSAIPLARFVSPSAAEKFKKATAVAFAKGHAMGKFGI